MTEQLIYSTTCLDNMDIKKYEPKPKYEFKKKKQELPEEIFPLEIINSCTATHKKLLKERVLNQKLNRWLK